MEAISCYHAPIKFAPPIAFPCIVNNKRLKARIVEERPDVIDYEFSIEFSDGTKADIISSDSGKWWVEPYSARPYINAVAAALHDFVAVKLYPWHMFPITYKGEELLVWVSNEDDKEEGQRYSIHFKGEYQFHLRKVKGKWESRSTRVVNPKPIDFPLASIIALKIEQD